MPGIHARADGVHHGERYVLTPGLPGAGPLRQLHGGMLRAVRTATGRLAADPPPLRQGPEDHLARQPRQLPTQGGVGGRREVIQ